MGYEQSVLRRATARLEAQRKAREEAQERLRSEIYAKLPRVAAIDRELRRTITQDHRRLPAGRQRSGARHRCNPG